MKKSNLLLSLLVAVTFIAFTSSCKEDDPIIPGGGDGIPVGDGFYITKTGVDPVPTSILTTENVEDDGFGAQAREGFKGGYVYLTVGDYVVVNVVAKAITETYGASSTAETEDTKVCETLNYNLVKSTLDGGTFRVAADGLYKVTYDAETGEIVYIHIQSAGIIGSATTIGWTDGSTIDLPGTVGADGGTWSISDVELREGEFKLRFNCSWFVDRRIVADNFLFANGYMLHTNFGGTTTELTNGNDGPGIPITAVGAGGDEDGKYNVDVTWTPAAGFSVALTRTGDNIPPPTFPEAMYLVGGGTAYDWTGPGDASHNGDDAMHKADGGIPTEGIYWKILHLTADTGFKISAAAWAEPNLGHGGVDEFDADGVAVSADGDGNMTVAASGMYMVVLDLQNDMTKVSIMAPEVYGIGPAFGAGDWAEDDATTLYTVDDVAKTITSPNMTGDGTIRSYANHPWIPAWWNAEFVVVGSTIEYRNDSGSDPTVVDGTTGQVMTLSFDDNTGSIN